MNEEVSDVTKELFDQRAMVGSIKKYLEVGLFQGINMKKGIVPVHMVLEWAEFNLNKVDNELKARPDAHIVDPEQFPKGVPGIQGK